MIVHLVFAEEVSRSKLGLFRLVFAVHSEFFREYVFEYVDANRVAVSECCELVFVVGILSRIDFQVNLRKL